MKKNLSLLLLLLVSVIHESSAWTILVTGGGRHQRFDRVYCTENHAECTGSGSLTCFPLKGMSTGLTRTIKHPIENVVNYVFDEVEKGNVNGQTNYENDLPLSWTSLKDGNVEITIQETSIQGIDNNDSEK